MVHSPKTTVYEIRSEGPLSPFQAILLKGDELSTDRQAVRFFYTAKGSSAEVLTQAIIALETGYLNEEDFVHIEKECQSISSMLSRLIQARSRSSSAKRMP